MKKFDSMTNEQLHKYAEEAVCGTPYEELVDALLTRNFVHFSVIEVIAKAIDMTPKQLMTMAAVADKITGKLDFSIDIRVHDKEDLDGIKESLKSAGLALDEPEDDDDPDDDDEPIVPLLEQVMSRQDETLELLREARKSNDANVKYLMDALNEVFRADIEHSSKAALRKNAKDFLTLFDHLKQALK